MRINTKRIYIIFFLNFIQGIQWLIDNSLLQNTSEHTAAFLFNETGLSKRAIGDYLGEKYKFRYLFFKCLFSSSIEMIFILKF